MPLVGAFAVVQPLRKCRQVVQTQRHAQCYIRRWNLRTQEQVAKPSQQVQTSATLLAVRAPQIFSPWKWLWTGVIRQDALHCTTTIAIKKVGVFAQIPPLKICGKVVAQTHVPAR